MDLIAIIRAFVNAESWDESREILDRHPELLTSEADVALAEFVRNAEEAGDTDAAHAFRIHRALLRRCDKIGKDSAFREMGGSEVELSLAPGFAVPREVVTEELLTLSRELWMGETDAPSRQWWDRRIRLCEQGIALTENRPDAALLCAAFQVELGDTLRATPTGDRSANLECAIASFEKAGQVWTADVAPVQWAMMQEHLGKVYDQRILGDPQDNRARAAACYRAAAAARGEELAESSEMDALLQELADPTRLPRSRMAVCRRVIELVSPPDDASLPLWTAAHITLAECLQSLPDGDRAENLEHAIVALETALGVCDRHRLPEEWAAAHAVLALVHHERVHGVRADNLERAIREYQLALQVRTRPADPAGWAATTNDLATAYWQRMRDDRAQNLETAIALLDAALTVRTRKRAPEQWATSQLNLGNVYQDRIVGGRAQNLEQAIGCYRDALSVWGRDRTPEQWAKTMNNLGAAYVHRALGGTAENIEAAIVIFESALEVRRRDRSPAAWAETTRNLGNAYCLRVRGTPAQNIDDAISRFQEVLDRPRELFPAEWAMAQIGIGNACSERHHGDRAADIERAIAAYESALSRPEPALRASALVGLGNAFLDRVRDGRAGNIELAIRHFEDAERVATRAAMPREWATIQHGLGIAYANRRLGERATNLQTAASAFERALEIRTSKDMPLDWVMTQQNLGFVLISPELPGDRSVLQERALAALEAAIGVVSAEAMPFRWADLKNNLGAVYGKRLAGDPAENQRAAVTAFTAADVWAEQAAPVARAQAQRNLGTALGDLSGLEVTDRAGTRWSTRPSPPSNGRWRSTAPSAGCPRRWTPRRAGVTSPTEPGGGAPPPLRTRSPWMPSTASTRRRSWRRRSGRSLRKASWSSSARRSPGRGQPRPGTTATCCGP
jgi:tetratricopeptide (TPR) repeat protein